jgi:predicted amidohydrolase
MAIEPHPSPAAPLRVAAMQMESRAGEKQTNLAVVARSHAASSRMSSGTCDARVRVVIE